MVSKRHHYQRSDLRSDLIAGLTVGCVALPQSMAYAMVAGVPPIYGLYGVIVAATVGALLSSSSHLTIGPTNTCALVTASVFAVYMREPEALKLLFLLTFMVGCIKLFAGQLRLGFLTDYISEAVMVGFTAAAGILIAGNQLSNLLGYESSTSPHFLIKVLHALTNIASLNPYALILGGLTVLITAGSRWLYRHIPGALLAVLITGWLAYQINVASHGVRLVGTIPHTLPPPRLFMLSFSKAAELASGALAIAVMGLFESVTIGRVIAQKTGQHIDPNREFSAIGTANIVGSFFQCIPSSGSFGRSALNFNAGARTRVAVFVSAAAVAFSMFLFSPLAYYIPIPTLAGILMIVAARLVDLKRIHSLSRISRDDRTVMAVTFGSALLIRLEFALFLGIGLSVLLFLQRARHVHFDELVFDADGRVLESSGPTERLCKDVAIINIEGDLFFGAAREFREHLGQLRQDEAKVMILRLKRARGLDATILHLLCDFVAERRRQGKYVLLSGIWGEIAQTIGESSLYELVGGENVFIARRDIFHSTRRAVNRAHELIREDAVTPDEGMDT